MAPVDSRQNASGWVLVALMAFAAFAACSNEAPTPPPDGGWGKGVYVGPEFELARAVTGHRVHVQAQKIECTKCHTPDEKSMGPPVKPERCAACHEKEAKLEHAKSAAEKRFGAGAKADCTTCHAFVFDGANKDEARQKADALRAPVDGGTGPTAMHGIELHPAGDCSHCHAEKQGDTPAVVSHLKQVCLACHKPHEQATPTSAPCTDCHDTKTAHASESKTIQDICTTCHQNLHEPASAALPTCAACHAKEQPIVPATALFAGGHTECTGCHKPHEFDSKKALACVSCHAQKAVIGGGKIAAHNGCSNCHTPHNVRASPAAACTSCHKSVKPSHPPHAGSACTGCHDAHPDQGPVSAVAAECSSCHRTAHSDTDFHRGVACEGCHKPHNFKLALTNLGTCEGCHQKRVSQVHANAGHQACTNCHQGLPHRPEAVEVGCQTCHGREHSAANRGHQACTNCHEPHSGAQGAACGNCHKQEHQTAPAGHQACTNCHEPHGGKTQKVCTACHADEAATAHGKLANGCLSCHRPHGPSGAAGPPGVAAAPACTSCHKLATLPGLHAETKHQTCTTCHSGHGTLPTTARQACLSCHKDRAEHFPNADRCANCHLFTKTR